MSTLESKYIRSSGELLHYKISGKGMPVVLLHGFAEDGNIWNNVLPFLQQDNMLIIPDLPGSGESTLLEKENPGLEDYAAAVKNILAVENIDRCVMIGHSMGGYVSLAFEEKYPGMLTALGLFHSSSYADNDDKKEARRKSIAFIKKNGAPAFLETAVTGLFYDPGKSKAAIDLLLRQGNNFTTGALIQYYEAMIARPDRSLLLKETILPVLLILGEHDQAVPFKSGLEQARMPTYTYIHILRSSAHMGMLEEAEKSGRILAEFLQVQAQK